MEGDGWSSCERVAIDDLAAVECLRSLAGLIRTGLPLRAALLAWPDEVSEDAREALAQVGRRLSLGDGAGPALTILDSVWDPRASAALRTVLIVHLRVGGNVASMVDSVADGLARRAESLEAARAAAAGMRLSGRMVAALPMIFLPLTGMARAPLTDLVGVTLLGTGSLLCVLGLLWMKRLVPAAPDRDGTAWLADIVSSALRGGTGLHRTLEVVAARAPVDIAPELERARRMVALGSTWGEGFRRSGSAGLASLAEALDRSRTLGLPIAESWRDLARRRDEAAATSFEAQLRRAPVRMVLPLTLCILPAFGLLALAPFLRGLATF
jgi:tight adherence protein B